MTRFEKKQQVLAEHIDSLGHVNNVVYLQWVQDVAGAHWFDVAGDEHGIIWVARKHEIEYFKPAFKDEILTLTTWVENMDGFRSIRRVDIIRDASILCSCTTHWISLNRESGRPQKISQELKELFK